MHELSVNGQTYNEVLLDKDSVKVDGKIIEVGKYITMYYTSA